ncbi:hypothetical protein ACSBR1_042061 [Camellia fascicularis]
MLSGQASALIQGRRARVAATSSVLKNTNVRFKDTVNQLRSSRNFFIDIILFLGLLLICTNKKCNRISCFSYCRGFMCLNTYIRHLHPCDRSKWICYSCSCSCYRNCCR